MAETAIYTAKGTAKTFAMGAINDVKISLDEAV